MYRRGGGSAELGRLKSGPRAVFHQVRRNLLEGMEDVQGGVVRAGAPGPAWWRGMSTREAARVYGLHRDTVRKMLKHSVPPGYRRQSPPRRRGNDARGFPGADEP